MRHCAGTIHGPRAAGDRADVQARAADQRVGRARGELSMEPLQLRDDGHGLVDGVEPGLGHAPVRGLAVHGDLVAHRALVRDDGQQLAGLADDGMVGSQASPHQVLRAQVRRTPRPSPRSRSPGPDVLVPERRTARTA